MLPSASYGNKAAAIPSTRRRGFWRFNSASMFNLFPIGLLCCLSLCRWIFYLLQLLGHLRLLVIAVEWIASRDQTIARRRGAVAKSTTDALALDLLSVQRIPEQLWVT